MTQRHITHAAGTFARCSSCGHEPRHYETNGAVGHEPPAFGPRPVRHQLECIDSCRRRTGWMPTLADAVHAWGVLGETMRLPLAPAAVLPSAPDNVRALRQGRTTA